MKDNKRLKRRVRNSYIVSTVSMALVLFLLGSVGYLMTAALRVARTLQESVTVTVELADGVDSLRRGEIERRLRARFGEGTMIAIHVEPLKAACRAE